MAPFPQKRLGWIVLAALLLLLGVRGWYVYAATSRLHHETPLLKAVKQGDTTAVRARLAQGDNPNSWERSADPGSADPRPLLLYSIQKGDLPTVGLLLDAGADPNTADATGHTALMSAVTVHRADIAQKLLEHGANIEQKRTTPKTAH
jgi:ankyrin repeat protein